MLRIVKNYAEFKIPLVSNNIGTVTKLSSILYYRFIQL